MVANHIYCCEKSGGGYQTVSGILLFHLAYMNSTSALFVVSVNVFFVLYGDECVTTPLVTVLLLDCVRNYCHLLHEDFMLWIKQLNDPVSIINLTILRGCKVTDSWILIIVSVTAEYCMTTTQHVFIFCLFCGVAMFDVGFDWKRDSLCLCSKITSFNNNTFT